MKKLAAAFGALAFFAAVGSASAASIAWNLTSEFSNAATPLNTLTVLLEDAGANTVNLTLSFGGNADANEYISEVYLNLKPTSPVISIVANDVSDVSSWSYLVDNVPNFPNSLRPDGDGFFNVLI